ncbi:MAG TPA: PQQ-dependent sugar dehydrogenase [Caulobacterales bacterium]|nr:PQQ-dependent sugar dehydrogenase [Caulobacterales bacterium]
MKSIFISAILGLAAAIAGAASAQTPATTPPPRPPSPAEVAFTSNCSGCHGTDLAGGRGPSLFADSLLSARSDADLLRTIQKGRPDGGMPAFEGQLKDDEISQIIAFLRVRGGELKSPRSFAPDPNGKIIKSEKQTFKVEVVAAGLETPWGAVFLPDGRMLVTERTGHIRVIAKGKLLPEPVKNTPVAWVRQDGGYFDIALHPDFKKNGWIYLSFSEVAPGNATPPPPPLAPVGARSAPGTLQANIPSMTRLVRGRINAKNEWVDQQDIYRAPADLYTTSVIHYGSRFLFDREGHLFWSVGDRGNHDNAQNLGSPLGKIHRVNDDGSAPKDNPFVNTPGAIASIWSYGHRNPEGLTFDPVTGLMWESEHGPTGGDEINVVEKGHNYGWGVISMGLEPGITKQHQAGMEDPIRFYVPSIGPSGMTFYGGARYPGWKNNLFLSALRGEALMRYEVKGREITHQEAVLTGFGRTRDVLVGPDGYLYVLLQNAQVLANSPGMVLRLVPAK